MKNNLFFSRTRAVLNFPGFFNKNGLFVAAVMLGVSCCSASGVTRYVDRSNNSPQTPFTNGWASAATSIQDAVDVSSAGDLILVAQGVYDTGVYEDGTQGRSRVHVSVAVTIRAVSTNPADTIIVGAADMTGGSPSNGPAAMRGVYLAPGAELVNFTVSNGWTSGTGHWEGRGGGIRNNGGVVSNCFVVNCHASSGGGGIQGGIVYNSSVIDCTATNGNISGGGISEATVYNSTIRGNRAQRWGGGLHSVVAYDSTISGNFSANNGGGAFEGELYRCILKHNTVTTGTLSGGGAHGSFLDSCIIISNTAGYGGGVRTTLMVTNCIISYNTATISGGGVYAAGPYYNCVISHNTAPAGGGGTGSTIYNSYILYNKATGGDGGGISNPMLINCLIMGNETSNRGGGLASGGGGAPTAINCTIVSNTAITSGSGAYVVDLRNSIVWYNAGNELNLGARTAEYTCSATLAHGVSGNTTNYPLFVDVGAGNFRLKRKSPCVDTGANAPVTTSFDLDGNPRILPEIGGVVDMGCYEYVPPPMGIIFMGQ